MSSAPPPRAGRTRTRAGLAVALLAALAVPLAARVGVDNRIELWVASGSPAAERHARFREDFGSDEFVLVAFASGDWLSPASLAAQDEVLASLEALPHVRRVAGPPAVRRDLLADPGDREALRRELLATPFYRSFLVAEDGRAAGLLVETALPEDPAARAALVHGVGAAVAPLERVGHDVAVVGPPVLNVALDELSRREAARTFPIAFVASLALVGFAFRSWRAAAVAGACAGAGVLLTFGVVGASGRSLNLVTAALPPLLWVLTLAGAVHLLARERAHRAAGEAPGPALDAAFGEVAGPCTMAAVTTALGFLSLCAADLRPVRELGAFAAVGVLLGLGVTLTLGPALLAKLTPRSEPTGLPGRGALVRLGALATRRPGLVLAGAAVAAVGVAASLPRVRVESDPLAFLPGDSTTARDYRFVARHLTGFYSLEVVVDTPGHWLAPAAWPPLDGVARELAATPGVRRVLTPLDLLRHLHALGRGRTPEAFALPADRAEARRLLDLVDAFGEGERTRLVAAGGERVRLSALIDVMPSSAFLAVVGAAERALAELPSPYAGHVTGIVLRLVEAQLDLVTTQLRSFAVAFATVFACLAAGLRSARLVVVAILPNLLPVASAFAAMVALGIALDAATVMMASVALGIAVDDTVHLLTAFRRALPRARSRAEAARAALLETGPAMAVTTAAACAGFAALLASAFAPIRWFGLLASLALGVALLADTVVAPATLATRLGGPLP